MADELFCFVLQFWHHMLRQCVVKKRQSVNPSIKPLLQQRRTWVGKLTFTVGCFHNTFNCSVTYLWQCALYSISSKMCTKH